MIKFLKSLNSNLVIALTALFISACALLLSIQEIRIMRSQQKANMYPHLTLYKSYNSSGFGWKVKNSGNGIARVNSFQIYDGDTYFKEWQDVIHTLSDGELSLDYNYMSTNNVRNAMLMAGEEVTIFWVRWTDASRRIDELAKEISMRVCYESLLGECWVIEEGDSKEIDGKCKVVPSREFNYSE